MFSFPLGFHILQYTSLPQFGYNYVYFGLLGNQKQASDFLR
jgi:hypothetical protein